jgi:ABC-type branched-subunit amino acid transport system ATPase component
MFGERPFTRHAAEVGRRGEGCLSSGEQQVVALGRALMAPLRLLRMDEPSMGFSPTFIDQVFDMIQAINEQDTADLLSPHHAATPRCGGPLNSGRAKTRTCNHIVMGGRF